MIGFTGGTHTGRAIMAAAGRDLKPCILELGGKSANIITGHADLERALDGALRRHLRQQRPAVPRRLAHPRAALRVGPVHRPLRRAHAPHPHRRPHAATTEIGPLCFRGAPRARARLRRDREGRRGAAAHRRAPRQRIRARPVHGADRGAGAANSARVCQEEIFGPFATFLVFDTIDEAIAIANESPFGLVSYVWSQDLDEVMRSEPRRSAPARCGSTRR